MLETLDSPSTVSLLVAMIAVIALVFPLFFWYHLSGIHKQVKRSAEYLEDIDQHIRILEARDRNESAAKERMPSSPLGSSELSLVRHLQCHLSQLPSRFVDLGFIHQRRLLQLLNPSLHSQIHCKPKLAECLTELC